MTDHKELTYTFARRKRNLSRISEELIWAGDLKPRTHKTLVEIATAVAENNKTDEEMLGRFIF